MSPGRTDVLLVEDDRRLAALTARYLEQNGFSVVVEARGDQALSQFARMRPRIVLLDLMLPGLDGLSICREIRKQFDGPILIFTAKDTDIDQVIGLEAGADDYVCKPADPIVVLARTRALLRRAEQSESARGRRDDIVLGALRISEASQQVWLDAQPITLTTQEFELLVLLARRTGQVLSREEIYRSIRGIEYDGMDRSIDGRISRLRKKLNDDADAPTRIKTVWGKGYLLVPDAWGAPE